MEKYDREYWNSAHRKMKKHYYQGVLCEYKKFFICRVLDECKPEGKILVTDLFDEAFNCDAVLSYFNKNLDVTAIDISDEIIRRVRRYANSVNIQRADCRKLPFRDSTFNFIFSPSTLDHSPKEEMQKAMKELIRVLKPNGRILIIMQNKRNMWLQFFLANLIYRPPYEYYNYSKSDLVKICKDNNLKILNLGAANHHPLPIIMNHAIKIIKYLPFKSRVKIYNWIEYLGKLRLKFFTGQLIYFLAEKID